MSKLFKLLIIILFVSCSSSQVNIESKQTNLPIIIRLAKDEPNRIITIQIPNKITIRNHSYEEKTFLRIYYKYRDSISRLNNSGYGMDLFTYDNKKLNRISNKKRKLKAKQNLRYTCYSSHYISEEMSKKLNDYVLKIKESNRDTVLESFNIFKNKYGNIFKELVKKDSISIQFLDNDKLGERITVPVKWD